MIAMNARILGDPNDPAVILLHGWGGSIRSMAALQDRLAAHYYVHAVDLPGFGATPLPEAHAAGWNLPDYAAWLRDYLDSANIARAHLIGHSFGGRVGIVFSAEYPDRVDKLVLTGSPGLIAPQTHRFQPRRRLYRTIRRGLNAIGQKTLAANLQRWYWDRYASEDYKSAGALRQTFVKVVQQDLAPYAARIAASTLLIWGDQDQEAPLWQAQKYEKLIRDAGLVIFKGAGHFAFQERLNDFARIVETFFAP